MTYTIPVAPTAKARARVTRFGNYTPSKTVDAEERIRWHLRQEKAVCAEPKVPLWVELSFFVKRPKKSGVFPTSRPDLDQFVKLVLDAGNGILWADDSQIVSVTARKFYCSAWTDPRIYLEVTEGGLDDALKAVGA